jgi:hypothetical protein
MKNSFDVKKEMALILTYMNFTVIGTLKLFIGDVGVLFLDRTERPPHPRPPPHTHTHTQPFPNVMLL